MTKERTRHRRKTAFDPPSRDSLRDRIGTGARFGAYFAAFGLAAGALRGLVAWLSGGVSRLPFKTLLIAPVYIASLVATGALGGALWPMRRSWLGRTALALLLGFLFFVGPMILVFGDPRRWGHDEWWVYRFCGLALAGIIWWVVLRDEPPPSSESVQ